MKILVRSTNWIGDAIMSVPALHQLRRIFPDARITLHTPSWAEGLFVDAPFIDELVTFGKDSWKIRQVYDNSQFLRDDKFDLAILMPNSFESALTSFLTRIPRRIGYNKDVRGLLLTDPIAVPEWKNRRHEAFYYLHLVAETERRLLGTETVSQALPITTINVSRERKNDAVKRLEDAGVDPGKQIVGLGVGSTNSRAKRWPAERFAQLNDMLQSRLGCRVVLLGSESERDVCDQVSGSCSYKPIDLAGKTDLADAVAVLAVLDLMISNDMGLAHIAGAVETPTMVLFGPTNSVTTRPFSDQAFVIEKNVECSPCMLRDCPIDHRCMTRISVEEVFNDAEARLAASDEQYDDAAGSIH
ncbi:MAG: lipopolysaccharide heptosyltransferase II [Pyrinomonadaceae bacterium]